MLTSISRSSRSVTTGARSANGNAFLTSGGLSRLIFPAFPPAPRWPWNVSGTGTGWWTRSKPPAANRFWPTPGKPLGHINKTDKLDADGLALLLHLGTLPQVWIPPGELRDERELPRTRMALTHLRTALKNRIHATLAKYGLAVPGVSDLFGERGRQELGRTLDRLPPETRRCLEEELELVDHLGEQIRQLESRIRERVREERAMQLLKTLPGIGDILAIVIGREMGEISRFPDGEHFAAYAGVVPKVKSSGDRVRYGHLRSEANHYLKWAFMEAAIVQCQTGRWKNRHVCRL